MAAFIIYWCRTMRKRGACFAVAALSVIFFSSPPDAAYALRIGPFHLGVPFGHRHHYPRHLSTPGNAHEAARPELRQAAPRQAADQGNLALLYPTGALPAIFQNVFWPAFSSPWPFGYETIFRTAFAPVASNGSADQCRQSFDANATIERLRAEIGPNAEQMEKLLRLGGAMGAAAEYLAKSCPTAIPEQPTTRLQLMDAQLEVLTLAIDMIHQPLQDFEQSLTREQQARFSGQATAPATTRAATRTRVAGKKSKNSTAQNSTSASRTCGGSAAAIGWSIDEIDNSVQLTEQQRPALTDLQQTFARAARDLETHCPVSVPQSAVARLETIEARLDATWRAILSIEVALRDFENNLTDEQKIRFKATTFARQ
jgi:hypothetical protein